MTEQQGQATIQFAGMAGSIASVSVHLSTALWFWWAEIAIEHEAVAREARRRAQASGPMELGKELSDEMKASMVAITAAAHSIDGFYGSVKALVPLPPKVKGDLEKYEAARHRWIFETLRVGFRIGAQTNRVSKDLKGLFSAERDPATHSKETLRPAQPHPTGTNTAKEYVDYSYENAERAVDLMLDVLRICTSSPKPGFPGLDEWCHQRQPLAHNLEALRIATKS